MDLVAWEFAVLILAGFIGGLINVMAGGGSIITMPVMMFLGVPGPVANATNRIPVLAHNITAILTYLRHGIPQSWLILSLSLCAIPGAIVGSLISAQIPTHQFNLVLAMVMVVVMALMLTGKDTGSVKDQFNLSRIRLVFGHLLMILAGFWGGFIQIGIGFVLLPILHRVLSLNLIETNIYKVFIILSYTVAALLIFENQLEILWWIGVVMAVGNAGGGWLGARLTLSRGERIIRPALVVAIGAMIVKLIWFP